MEPIKADRYKEGAEKAIEDRPCCAVCNVFFKESDCPLRANGKWCNLGDEKNEVKVYLG